MLVMAQCWLGVLRDPLPSRPTWRSRAEQLENTLLGVGGGIEGGGGRIKFLPRGASKYTPPPPSPEKCLLAKIGGRGGGGLYNFSSEACSLARLLACLLAVVGLLTVEFLCIQLLWGTPFAAYN